MDSTMMAEIESRIDRLSRDEQLLLAENLIRRVRNEVSAFRITEDDLAAMAADPNIQRELREIAEEFASSEMDGLEDD